MFVPTWSFLPSLMFAVRPLQVNDQRVEHLISATWVGSSAFIATISINQILVLIYKHFYKSYTVFGRAKNIFSDEMV